MDIMELLRALWRKKWLLIATAVVTAIISVVFLRYSKEKYKSAAQLSTGYTESSRLSLNDEELNLPQSEVKFSNLMALMNSPLSINFLSYRLLLHDLDSIESRFRTPKGGTVDKPVTAAGEMEENLKNLVAVESSSADTPVVYTQKDLKQLKDIIRHKLENLLPLKSDDPYFEQVRTLYSEFGYGFKDIRESLSIYRLPNTDYIQVEFTSENKYLSAYAANAFCQEFIRYYNTLKSGSSEESVEYLERRVNAKREELDEKLAKLNEFKSSNDLMDQEVEGGTRMAQLVDLENQRDEVISSIQGLELTIQRLRSELNSTSQGGSSNNARIVDLQERINNLNSRYISGGSSNNQLLDSINMFRSQLRTLIGSSGFSTTPIPPQQTESLLKDAEIQYQVAQTRLSQINSKIGQLRGSFSGYTAMETEFSAIQNEVELASQGYLAALAKYNDAKTRLDSTNSLRQILAATPAVSPISIKKIYVVMLASIGGFALAVFAVILMEVTDFSIKTPSRFRQVVKMPFVGALNRIEAPNFNIQNLFLKKTPENDSEITKSLLRLVRHEMESMNAKIFLFTSLKRNEGKSFAIYSLSYVLSLLNKKVLIIDTNFKSNTLTQIYGQDVREMKQNLKMIPSRLLNEALVIGAGGGGEPAPEPQPTVNAYDLINPTKYKNIFFVGNTGVLTGSPSELLSVKDFKKFLALMSTKYDYIFLEGAALNEYPDTKELVGYAEKVIAVFSAESVIDPIDQKGIDYLKSLEKRLGGAILNKVDRRDLRL